MADWDGTDSTYRTLGKFPLLLAPLFILSNNPDHNYEMRQLRMFQKMVGRGKPSPSLPPAAETDVILGLVYRHYRPVHYSPSSRSALAEAELVYKDDHVSHSIYVTFDLDLRSHVSTVALQNLVSGQSKVRLLVWTTTPWTLTANMVRPFLWLIHSFL